VNGEIDLLETFSGATLTAPAHSRPSVTTPPPNTL
jgi:2-aminoadipate transaminase